MNYIVVGVFLVLSAITLVSGSPSAKLKRREGSVWLWAGPRTNNPQPNSSTSTILSISTLFAWCSEPGETGNDQRAGFKATQY